MTVLQLRRRLLRLSTIIGVLFYCASAQANPPQGYQIAGTRYYMTDAGVLALVLYIPLVLLVIGLTYALLLRRLPAAWKWLTLSGALVGAALLPFWDVYLIGQEAKTLCKDAGLKVYRTAAVEGFYGASKIELWSKYGFKYVEGRGTRHRKFRASIKDGKPVDEEVPEYLSRYGTNSKTHEALGLHFSRSRYWVEDIHTKEVLGELVTYSIYPGWLDSVVLPALGGSFTPWICGKWVPEELQDRFGDKYGRQDLIKATLIPKK